MNLVVIRVFSSYYEEQDERRRSEILASTRKNLENDLIDQVCLYLENVAGFPLRHEKIETREISSRPTYEDYFGWAEERQAGDDLTVIANSDIYFDGSLLALARALEPDQSAALARWDLAPTGKPALSDRNDSQDVWVFRGPLKRVLGDYPVGVPRCDNRFLFELKKAGYEVINPAFSVRAFHLHAGVREEYGGDNLRHAVDPPYAYLWPHNLWSLPRTVLFNIRHPEARVAWRFDQRKFDSLLPVRAIKKFLRAAGTRGR